MHKKTLALLIAATLSLPTLATEGGGSVYPVGVETNFTGLMLPEGSNALLYYQHYSADRVKDNNGQDNARVAHFKSQADVLALRYSYVWPGLKLAGANVETRAVLSLPSLELDMRLAKPPVDRGGNASGIGDMTLAPLLLGWHGPTLHQMAGMEVILPTGDYDKKRNINAGRNIWQAAALYGFTWLPGQWEASARVRYGINGRNADTDYRSGDELTLEFSGGYKFAPGWSAGLNGYLYRQVTDDVRNGNTVYGNRASVNAIGPYVAHAFSRQASIVAKIQIEADAKNRAEGQRLWIQARYAF